MKINYEEFAKHLMQQMNVNSKPISIEEFTKEYISFVEKNRAEKTCEGVRLVTKHMLAYFPAIKDVNTIELRDAEKFTCRGNLAMPNRLLNFSPTDSIPRI